MSSKPEEQQQTLLPVLAALERWISVDGQREQLVSEAKRLKGYIEKLHPLEHGEGKEAEALYFLMKSKLSASHRLPKPELRAAQRYFWRLLESQAQEWDFEELSNVLSYSLGTRVESKRHIEPKSLVRVQRRQFEAMPAEKRDFIFEELLRRVATEKSFRNELRLRATGL